MKKNVPGFTLVEMLLVVGLLAIIAGFSLPVYQSFQNKNDLTVAAMTLVQVERRAQTLSQSGTNDASWGVKIQSGTVVLFKGISYIARDTTADEVNSISPAISIAGVNEIVFSKIFGMPGTTGTTTLTSINNDTTAVGITSKGTISY